jgi:hypothetical protein
VNAAPPPRHPATSEIVSKRRGATMRADRIRTVNCE